MNAPWPPCRGDAPANRTGSVHFGDLARVHTGDQDVAVRHAGRAKSAGERFAPNFLSRAVDFADVTGVDAGNEVIAVRLHLDAAPVALRLRLDGVELLARR